MAKRTFAMKLLNEWCLECSICAIFFNPSLMVSINTLFLNRILLTILISEFLILFLTLVTSYIPLRKRFSNNACPTYLLSVHNFLFMFSKKLPYFKTSQSSTFLGINMKFSISSLSLTIKWSLNPKNHPIEHFSRLASHSKFL